MAIKKITKKEKLQAILDYFKKNDIVLVENYIYNKDGEYVEDFNITSADMVEFALNEIAILEKKYNSTNSKTSLENSKLKEILLNELSKIGKPVTITELMNNSEVIKNYILENGNPLSNQKISSLFTTMFKVDKTIDRITDKKKTYFSIIEK